MTDNKQMKLRLVAMNFLQFAIWGAYLISMGTYLFTVGLGDKIGYFYAVQGVVSLFMPALMGIVADRWIPAQKLLALCHVVSALCRAAVGYYGWTGGDSVSFTSLHLCYTLGIAFYMPTLALSNSVAYTALEKVKLEPVAVFPSIRIWGTVGFICSMLATDLLGFQTCYMQFFLSAALGLVAAVYAYTLPDCPVNRSKKTTSWVDAMGLRAFTLFKQRKMALFLVFCVLMGVSLQITNGYANPFISSFASIPEYADTFGVQHANILISLSQLSETCCILLIPFALKRLGIKRVMLIAMLAWTLRFSLFGWGNPGDGVWMFVLSMLVYGVAFDFFNIAGSLYVNEEAEPAVRSSAQGLFMLMTNGIGATAGTLCAQWIVNRFVDMKSTLPQVEGWSQAWFVFAGYALVVAILFAVFFPYNHQKK